jgi:hypothetical protein
MTGRSNGCPLKDPSLRTAVLRLHRFTQDDNCSAAAIVAKLPVPSGWQRDVPVIMRTHRQRRGLVFRGTNFCLPMCWSAPKAHHALKVATRIRRRPGQQFGYQIRWQALRLVKVPEITLRQRPAGTEPCHDLPPANEQPAETQLFTADRLARPPTAIRARLDELRLDPGPTRLGQPAMTIGVRRRVRFS